MIFPDLSLDTTAKTASFTATVGSLYRINVTTAQIDVTFPASPGTGDKFGYFVGTQSTTVGSFLLAPGKMVEPNNPTILSATYAKLTVGCEKWGLLLSGEVLIWEYVDVTIGWRPYYDGRTMTSCCASDNTGTTSFTSSGVTASINTAIATVGALLDATNFRIVVKRSGNYSCGMGMSSNLQDDTERFQLFGWKNGFSAGSLELYQSILSPSTDQVLSASDVTELPLVATDYMELRGTVNDTFTVLNSSNAVRPRLIVQELR